MKAARKALGLSQSKLAEQLGWKSDRMISLIETGVNPMQKQTQLALECLLRREGKWKNFKKAMDRQAP